MNKGKVMYDGAPKEVFAHYRELEEVGLAAPQVTYILHALKDRGFATPYPRKFWKKNKEMM